MNPAYLACSGWIAASVGVAADLNIADLVAEGPRSVADLAGETGANPEVLRRVLRLLALSGVFELEDDACRNNADSDRLRSAHPQSVRDFCRLAAGDYQRAFTEIRHAVMTGGPATHAAFGATLYERLARTPEAAGVYHRAMDDLARGVGMVLARARDWSACRTVVDVGGGRGRVLRELLAIHTHLSGIVVDREPPDRDPDLDGALQALEGRLTFVAGDFFEGIPAGQDVYILKNVIHNWADERAVAILASVGASLTAPDARLLVIDAASDSSPSPVFAALDDLLQAVICEAGAGARNATELKALVVRAGLHVQGRQPLASGHVLIEAST